MIGIYHKKDLDGICCGAIMKFRYPDITLIGYNYGEDIPDIPSGEQIIMGDVSFDMETMFLLNEKSNNQLTWVDHHISAYIDYNNYIIKNPDVLIDYHYSNEYAACELMWRVLYPGTPTPTAVQLLGEYDVWKNSDSDRWSDVIMPFQYGMRLLVSTPNEFPKNLFLRECADLQDEIMMTGQIIFEYQTRQNKNISVNGAFEYNFNGYRAICINQSGANSMLFSDVYDESKELNKTYEDK